MTKKDILKGLFPDAVVITSVNELQRIAASLNPVNIEVVDESHHFKKPQLGDILESCFVTVIVDVFHKGQRIQVTRVDDRKYVVTTDGTIRHPDCTPEDAIRALGHYLEDGSEPASTA